MLNALQVRYKIADVSKLIGKTGVSEEDARAMLKLAGARDADGMTKDQFEAMMKSCQNESGSSCCNCSLRIEEILRWCLSWPVLTAMCFLWLAPCFWWTAQLQSVCDDLSSHNTKLREQYRGFLKENWGLSHDWMPPMVATDESYYSCPLQVFGLPVQNFIPTRFTLMCVSAVLELAGGGWLVLGGLLLTWRVASLSAARSLLLEHNPYLKQLEDQKKQQQQQQMSREKTKERDFSEMVQFTLCILDNSKSRPEFYYATMFEETVEKLTHGRSEVREAIYEAGKRTTAEFPLMHTLDSARWTDLRRCFLNTISEKCLNGYVAQVSMHVWW